MKKLIIYLFTAIALFITSPVSSAWEQETHVQINLEAIKKFETEFGGDEKYTKAPLVKENIYTGLAVSGTSLLDKNHKMITTEKTYEGWIIHGGYAADEPNVYASVRHFYDPLALSGKTWLTDQVSLHGTWNYIANQAVPEIDAKTWGLNHPDNPYSFQKAMEYYHKAMTIRETQVPVGFLPSASFRSQYMKASNLQEERDLYLAAAFRALGETMHLLADMTQPAHVRNDSHPKFEPLEQTINASSVRDYVSNAFWVDPEIGKYYRSASGNERYSVEQLFEETSKYTNKNFFSADTIYDKATGLLPKNGEKGYPSPQLLSLIHQSTYSLNNRLITGSTIYFSTINGVEVPLARVDMLDRLQSEGLVQNIQLTEKNFNIPPTMALQQGEVLIPAAIAACSDLMDRFFPTLELTAELGKVNIERDVKNNEKAIYPVLSHLRHDIKSDIEWQKANKEIKYSGPGRVVMLGEGNSIKEFQVNFVDGTIAQIQDYKNKKKMVDGLLKFYLKKSPKIKLTREEAFFEVEEGSMFYVEVEAGGRLLRSDEVYIESIESVLEISYDPEKPSRLDDISFTVTGQEGLYYAWDFGDGETQTGQGITEINHQYDKNGEYEIKVSAYQDSALKVMDSVGRTKIKLEEKFDISFIPGNNLEARTDDTVEIAIKPIDQNIQLERYKIQWDTPGATGKSSTDEIQLSYSAMGRYNVGVKLLNEDGEIVASSNAVIDIVEGSLFTIEPLEATITMKKQQKYTAMIDGKPTSDVIWSVREGEIGGVFNDNQTYTAPQTPGVYHIIATSKTDPSKTAVTAVNVIRSSGRWKLVSHKVEEQPNEMGSGRFPQYNGSSTAGDNSYSAEVSYNPPDRPNEASDYTMSATWSEMPEYLSPLDTLEILYNLNADGSYDDGRLSFTFSAPDSYDRLRSISFGSVNVKDKNTYSGKAEFKVREYGTGSGSDEKLEFKIVVDPFYQYIGKVTYRFVYEYEP